VLKLEDAKFIWSLMPGWIKEQPDDLCATMYGTLTREGDVKIMKRVRKILFPNTFQ